jgi:hypothetical protein
MVPLNVAVTVAVVMLVAPGSLKSVAEVGLTARVYEKMGPAGKKAVWSISGLADAESATVTQKGGLLDNAHWVGLDT